MFQNLLKNTTEFSCSQELVSFPTVLDIHFVGNPGAQDTVETKLEVFEQDVEQFAVEFVPIPVFVFHVVAI